MSTTFVQQQTYTRERYCGPISLLIGLFIPCGFWICFCPIDEVEVRRGPRTVVYANQQQPQQPTQVVVNVPYQQGGNMGQQQQYQPSQGGYPGYTQAVLPPQQQQYQQPQQQYQQYQQQPQYQQEQNPVQQQQQYQQAPPAYHAHAAHVPVVASAPDYGTNPPLAAQAYPVNYDMSKNQE